MKTEPIKTVTIPKWATHVVSIGNGIDGWAPHFPELQTVQEFLWVAPTLPKLRGGGEWDLLIYAVSNTKGMIHLAPYGKDNSYRTLRGSKTCKTKKLAQCSYMGWPIPRFELSP